MALFVILDVDLHNYKPTIILSSDRNFRFRVTCVYDSNRLYLQTNPQQLGEGCESCDNLHRSAHLVVQSQKMGTKCTKRGLLAGCSYVSRLAHSTTLSSYHPQGCESVPGTRQSCLVSSSNFRWRWVTRSKWKFFPGFTYRIP